MPQMADVTVKAADGTTNVVYVSKVPSAGDKSPAKWTADAASTTRDHRPVATLMSKDNGDRSARVMTYVGNVPIVRTIDGVPTVVARVPANFEIRVPGGITDVETGEAVARHVNFCAASLPKQVFVDGYAPT